MSDTYLGEINYITYLSPGIPEKFFQRIVETVGESTGIPGSLVMESGVSGPPRDADDPFSSGEVDLGFMCAPPYLRLREREPSPVELLGVAPVPVDPRCNGRPVYFSDVVVKADSDAHSFDDLRGNSWAYNDPCSMSGYFGMLSYLKEIGEDSSFFGETPCSGGHARSLEMLLSGEVDVVAVDSNALATRFRREPELRRRLRPIAGLGPFPIQPVVVSSALPDETKSLLRDAFLTLDLLSEPFVEFGFERFAPVTDEHYEPEVRLLDGITPATRGNRGKRRAPRPADTGSGSIR